MIALLAPSPDAGLSGVTPYVSALALALARRGKRVLSIKLGPGLEDAVRTWGFGRLRQSNVRYRDGATAGRLLDEVVSRSGARVLHSHADALLPIAAWVAERRRMRLVHTVHYVHPDTSLLLSRYGPEVVAVSQAVAGELALPCEVLPNFAEMRWRARRGLGARASRARAGAGIGPDEKLVLFAGRANSPTKGADTLLAAAALIWAAGTPSVRLAFAGTFWVRGEADLIANRFRSRLLLLGLVPRPRLFVWYRAADAVVVPSRYEPFGMVALEAQTVGTPVVASATGGLVEVVHPRLGRRVPLEGRSVSPEELATALSDVLRQPPTRDELADWALVAFPEQSHVERLIRLYEG